MARRHQAVVRLALTVLVLGVIFLAIGLAVVWKAKQEADQARNEEGKALTSAREALTREKHGHYLASIALADCQLLLFNPWRANLYLDACQEEPQWEWHYLKNRLHAEPRTLPFNLKAFPATRAHCVTFSQDSKRLLARSAYAVRLWDVTTGKQVLGEDNRRGLPYCATALSPDGQFLLGPVSEPQGLKRIRRLALMNLTTGQQAFGLEVSNLPGCVAFAPDGRLAAIGGKIRP